MAVGVGSRGILRVVSPTQLAAQEAANDAEQLRAETARRESDAWNTSLAGFIDNEFSRFQRHRDSASGWTDRIVEAMRVFNGEYSPDRLREIRKLGGSEIYARLIATKCRGASSLLRDIYLNIEKPWGLSPTPDPTLPDDIQGGIQQLVQSELASMVQAGQMPDPNAIRDRVEGLMRAAKRAAIKRAQDEAKAAEAKLDDLLVEGGFYEALAEFITDLPLFPFACLKGPVVRIVPQVTWVQGKAQVIERPRMFWYRLSPFDVWWTPGVSKISDAAVIERTRLTRQDLNQMLGLPGYNEAAVRAVLEEYGRSGYVEANSGTADQPRAEMESREDPRMNSSGLIDQIEYHGYVQGRTLLDQGLMSPDVITDPDLDYFVDAFKVGRYILKVQISPSLRKRPPYYVTSFEKVPGTVVGNALPDILADIQDSANSCLRALNNNMGMASGPQIDVNVDMLHPSEDPDDFYPWKRWRTVNDPLGNNSRRAVEFYQPDSRAQELLGVFEKLSQYGDELSAIPRYITGSERLGGAGRTASGLAMLMGNAAKIMQTVASNIDGDVVEQVVTELYDMVMLTDTSGILRGDESIDVKGVQVAIQRETQRQRQLELLSISANPIDSQIMGVRGRSNLLRAVSEGVGLPGTEIVPPEEEIRAMTGGPGGPPPGAPPGAPGGVSAPQLPGGPPPGAGPPGGPPAIPGPPQGPRVNAVGDTPGSGG